MKRSGTGRLAGLETLIRWPHPERGIVTPTEFYDVAEELGLIVTIGDWIITQACETFRRWRKRFPHHEDLALYINLSKQQFVLGDFMETLKGVLADTRIEPACPRAFSTSLPDHPQSSARSSPANRWGSSVRHR